MCSERLGTKSYSVFLYNSKNKKYKYIPCIESSNFQKIAFSLSQNYNEGGHFPLWVLYVYILIKVGHNLETEQQRHTYLSHKKKHG